MSIYDTHHKLAASSTKVSETDIWSFFRLALSVFCIFDQELSVHLCAGKI